MADKLYPDAAAALDGLLTDDMLIASGMKPRDPECQLQFANLYAGRTTNGSVKRDYREAYDLLKLGFPLSLISFRSFPKFGADWYDTTEYRLHGLLQ